MRNPLNPLLPAGVAKICAIVFAAGVLYMLLLSVSIGDYHPGALFAGIVVILLAFSTLLIKPTGPMRSYGWLRLGVVILLIGQVMALWVPWLVQHLLPYWSQQGQRYLTMTVTGVSVGLLVGLLLSVIGWKRSAVAVVGLGAVLQFSVCAYMLSSLAPEVDVWYFHHEAINAVSQGKNPYAITFTNMHNNDGKDDSPLYSKEVQKDGRLLFGYPYPPLALMLVYPSEILTQDARYGLTAYYLGAAVLLAAIDVGGLAICAAAVLMLAPCCWLVFSDAWTEPQLILAMSAVVWCAVRKKPWLPVMVGLFFSLKQYTIVFFPILFVILPRPLSLKSSAKFLAMVFGTMAIVSLPLALWDWPAFWRSNVYIQMIQPFRYDSLSFLALYARSQLPGTPPPSPIIAAVVLLPVEALLLWRLPRNIAGFALGIAVTMIVFLFLNRQAFLNYHIFAASALLIAAASFEAVYATPSPAAPGEGSPLAATP